MKVLPVLQPLCCAPDVEPLDARAAADLASCFKALADPTRVAIVNRLAAAGEVCVCDLTAAFDLSQPTVSHHLKLLREAGLVDSTRRGTWAYYRLVPETIAQLAGALGTTPTCHHQPIAWRIDPEGVETAALAKVAPVAGLRVLELGCGDGRLTVRYADAARSVLAVDPDAERIAQARAGLPERMAGKVTFAVSGAEEVDAPRAGFDLALFSWSL